MRKRLLFLALSAWLANPAHAASVSRSFDVTNATGRAIGHLYVSPGGQSSWSTDVLGEGALTDGQSRRVTFNADEAQDEWDLKTVYTDGEEVVWQNYKLPKIRRLILKYEREHPSAATR